MSEDDAVREPSTRGLTSRTHPGAPPTGSPPRLTLSLCDGVRVTGNLGSLGPRELGGARSRHILIALSARTGRPVSKVELVRLLWGADRTPGAIRTLETYVCRLRQRFDGVAAGGGAAIRTVPAGYALDPAIIRVDLDAFAIACRAARDPALPAALALKRWAAALRTVDGEFLAGEPGLPWLDDARRRHQLRLAGILAEAAETALRAGSSAAAGAFAARGLALDRLHEGCWRLLLESYEARGLHGAGLRAFDDCRRTFAEKLGCAPSPSVQAVFERMVIGADGSPPDAHVGLTEAVQAVVRLYTWVAPDDAPHPRGPDLGQHPLVVTEAYQLLHDLLLQVDRMGAPRARTA